MASELSLRILISELNIPLAVAVDCTVGALRRIIQQQNEVRQLNIASRTLKLIYQGRLLSDDAQTVAEANIPDGAHIHVAVIDRQPSMGSDVAVSFGSAGAEGQNTSAIVGQDRLGFDRLTILGLDSDDIAVLRAQFLPEVEREFATLPLEPGETETHRLLRMEDAWLRSQPDSSEFALNLRPLLEARRQQVWAPWMGAGVAPSLRPGPFGMFGGGGPSGSDPNTAPQGGRGTLSSFLWGVVCGMWAGPFVFLLLFLVVSPTVTTRFKLGVVTGFIFNLSYALASDALSEGEPEPDKGDSGAGSGGSSGSGGGSGSSAGSRTPWGPGAGAGGLVPGASGWPFDWGRR